MPFPSYVFFGNHKCGSSWVRKIVNTVCDQIGLTHAVWTSAEITEGLGQFIKDNRAQLLCLLNSNPSHPNILGNFRGFHVIRDPRDLAVSAYFSHLYSHPIERDWPELDKIRAELQGLSKEDGLFITIENSKRQFRNMEGWDYTRSDILELKFESMLPDPLSVFTKIFEFLGLKNKVAAPVISKAVEMHCFERLSGGRPPGKEDIYHHYRKGIPGDWKNHFTQRHIDLFKSKYPSLLIKLGYECSDNW